MAQNAMIQERGTVSGNQMRMARPLEDAAQTFKPGTPLVLNPTSTNGAVGAPTATVGTLTALIAIAGIAKEFGVSLATAGVPLGTQPATGVPVGTIPSQGGGPIFGSVPNMSGAVNMLRPVFNDGRTGVVLAIPDTVFYAQIGPGPSSATPAPAPTQADIGQTYGLTLDTDGVSWYIDRTKNTTTTGCLKITGLDQWDTARGVLFTFLPTVATIPA
jgi:hypothetical protein